MAEQFITQKVDFFKFKELLYVRDSDYDKLTAKQKADNAFMTNRNVAIAFPQIAQAFNKLGMDMTQVMNAYHRELGNARQPKWSFISGKKVDKPASNATVDAINKFDKRLVDLYMQTEDIDSKTWRLLVQCHADELLNELIAYQKQLQ